MYVQTCQHIPVFGIILGFVHSACVGSRGGGKMIVWIRHMCTCACGIGRHVVVERTHLTNKHTLSHTNLENCVCLYHTCPRACVCMHAGAAVCAHACKHAISLSLRQEPWNPRYASVACSERTMSWATCWGRDSEARASNSLTFAMSSRRY